MNPFWWLLWAVCALVVIFIAAAVYVVIRDGIRAHAPCPRCGYEPGQPDTPPESWFPPGDIDEGPPVR